jgi:hypothetical protein
MRELILNQNCFAREKSLIEKEFGNKEKSFFVMAEVLLLRECLRQVFDMNLQLNSIKSESSFDIFISNRLFSSLEERDDFFLKKKEIIGERFVRFGVYGEPILSAYSILEMFKYNNIVDFDVNPYEYGLRVLERGNIISREMYPKSFHLNGYFRVPIELTRYSQVTPYIVNTSDDYLDAINNYYKQFEVSQYENVPQPQWLVDDNQRGYISEEYKKRL